MVIRRDGLAFAAAFLCCIMILGCGGLRYSQLAPEAADFRPKIIGVLPVDVGTYEEARGIVDDIIAGELVGRKWFQNVIPAESMRRRLLTGEEARSVAQEYVAKLKTVSFSDPELSRKLGELLQVEAFLIVNVDYWQYTVENKERRAKVGMSIKMIDSQSGVIMWRASHHEIETYKWVKPELSKVAKKLVSMMVDEMPH